MIPDKYLFGTMVAAALLLAYSCGKQASAPDAHPVTSTSLVEPSRFHKAIGAPILRTTANVWKQRYQATHKTAPINYRLQAPYLKTLLRQTPEVVGLAFYWVQTPAGLDLVPIPVTAQGYLIKTTTLTSARGQVWSWAEVKQLRDRYSGPTKACIFGANTFTRLMDEQGAVSILLEPAINDKGEEVLVLSNEATPDSEYVEDNGQLCPPACPTAEINTL